MVEQNETLWQTILFASEIDLKGTYQLSEHDRDTLASYPELHLAALKRNKQNVEYQFSNHKLIMAKYYQDFQNGDIDKEEYDDLRLEQLGWKTKAASYLARIEQKMTEIKVGMQHANN